MNKLSKQKLNKRNKQKYNQANEPISATFDTNNYCLFRHIC